MKTLTSAELTASLELHEFVPGRKAQVRVLQRVLPDVETALFFAKALKMDYTHLRSLLSVVFKTTVLTALFGSGEAHSNELQDYLVETIPPDVYAEAGAYFTTDEVPHAEILPEAWDSLDVQVAQSIATVADKLSLVLDSLPSKLGAMTFSHMAKLNRSRPTIGTYQAVIGHAPMLPVLVILDDSGSMGEETVAAIAGDCVALGWKADAHFALVSNSCRYWAPGSYSVEDVLKRAEYSGTHYETLAPLFDQDWGTVVTIADYDSSPSAKAFMANVRGRVGRVLDLSLVDRPSYLAEVIGQLAGEVTPLLVASNSAHLTN